MPSTANNASLHVLVLEIGWFLAEKRKVTEMFPILPVQQNKIFPRLRKCVIENHFGAKKDISKGTNISQSTLKLLQCHVRKSKQCALGHVFQAEADKELSSTKTWALQKRKKLRKLHIRCSCHSFSPNEDNKKNSSLHSLMLKWTFSEFSKLQL